MSNADSLTYGDLAAYLSEYPPDATMLVEHLADADWARDFDPAPNTVGRALEHCLAMPEDGLPVI